MTVDQVISTVNDLPIANEHKFEVGGCAGYMHEHVVEISHDPEDAYVTIRGEGFRLDVYPDKSAAEYEGRLREDFTPPLDGAKWLVERMAPNTMRGGKRATQST